MPFGPTPPHSGPIPIRPVSGRSAFLTYEPYYGLREKPFSLSADPRFLYKSRTHSPVFDDLLAGIRRREGLIVLTGDIGTGKTTLCRSVLHALDHKTFSAFVPDPFVSREDLLKTLLIDFGVMSVDELRSGRLHGATRADLSYPLYEFLNTLVPLQAFAVLIVDEAQNLSVPLLEELRILSDLEAPEKLLQVVLVGQLELQPKLKLPEMRQLDQRVSVRCRLHELERDAIGGYISHRLSVAGASSDRVSFSESAIDLVFNASGGVPRIINLVCDRALHHGHEQRASVITPELVRAALAALDLVEGDETSAPNLIEAPRAIEPLPVHNAAPTLAPAVDAVSSAQSLHAAVAELFDIDVYQQDLDLIAEAMQTFEPVVEEEEEEKEKQQESAVPVGAYESGHLLFETRGSDKEWRASSRRHRFIATFLVMAVIGVLAGGIAAGVYVHDLLADLEDLAIPTIAPPPLAHVALDYQPKTALGREPIQPLAGLEIEAESITAGR